MIGLEVEPKLGSRSERLREEPRGLRRNTALAANNLVDALERDLEVFGETDLRDSERDEELLEEDLSGMGGNSILGKHGATSLPVVVDDADIVRLAGAPPEHNAPLLVNPDAVEAPEVSSKRLESIPRWLKEILQHSSGVQHIELTHRDSSDLRRDPLDRLAPDPVVQGLGGPIRE
jgi:hypothetical protein